MNSEFSDQEFKQLTENDSKLMSELLVMIKSDLESVIVELTVTDQPFEMIHKVKLRFSLFGLMDCYHLADKIEREKDFKQLDKITNCCQTLLLNLNNYEVI
ncbi:hypothetical protein N9L20_07185 [Flavobacteriaceae bacterium]|nr:hypothetical protein [Flavobacteriaceae bacterium]